VSEPYLAEIRLFGFNFPPRGWAQCDGQILPINQNQSLYSLLGTTYGGDGRTTFALPDLRGRTAAHEGPSKGLGSKAGTETVSLATNEMPNHTHQLSAYSEPANSNVPGNRRFGQATTPLYHATDPSSAVPMNGSTLGNAGTNAGHDNMQPFQAVNFCIATQGLFPPRN
jgi:microcystin-dependent protein